MSEIHVVSGLILSNPLLPVMRALFQQRPAGKRCEFLWETPGGKVEKDEDPQDALRRELKEELGITVGDLSKPFHVETIPKSDLVDEFTISTYLVLNYRGKPCDLEGQYLEWFTPDEILKLDLTPGNRWMYQAIEDHIGFSFAF